MGPGSREWDQTITWGPGQWERDKSDHTGGEAPKPGPPKDPECCSRVGREWQHMFYLLERQSPLRKGGNVNIVQGNLRPASGNKGRERMC